MAHIPASGVQDQQQPQFKPGSQPNSPTPPPRHSMLGTQPVAPLSMYTDNMMASSHQTPSGGNRSPPYRHSTPMMIPPIPHVSATSPHHSLLAFDPLLSGGGAGGRPPKSVSPQMSPLSKSHREVQSMNAGDLRDIGHTVLEQERIRQEHNQKMRGHSLDVHMSSSLHNPSNNNKNHSRGNSPNPPSKQTIDGFPPAAKSPPRTRKLSGMFVKKEKKQHHRTKSLEASKIVLPPSLENNSRASLPTTPRSDNGLSQKSSMYPGIVSDLMDLNFNKLELPSLAKPSPTSFLTGKDDEVIRTSEAEAAPFQMEIPPLSECLVTARLNEFVDNYRSMDQNFDLQQWVGLSRMDLRQVKIPQHLPIAQSILECGDDVCLRGVVTKGSANADERLEVAVFEGQRQFLAVFRGTTEQQTKGISKSKKKTAVPLDEEHKGVEVYSAFLEEYMKLETECFAILDKLTDEEPFCDVVFSGHSFGGAMATLAAFRYANARPMMRVGCLTLASPKAGFPMFRQMVNSQPNLKVMRLELGQDGKCQLPGDKGAHVGHTLVLHGSLGSNAQKVSQAVLAYNFDSPKPKKFGTKHPDLRAYVVALEEISRLKLKWVKDFVGTSGKGVVVNNESRLVV